MNPYKMFRSVVRFGRRETEQVECRLGHGASVADLRRIAKHRLPGGVSNDIDGGAEDERTLVANQAAGGLNWTEAVQNCLYGRIESTWHLLDDGTLRLTVTVPAGSVAEVRLPDGTRTEQSPGTPAYQCSIQRAPA